MNGKAIGETIEDVASSISNSNWAKSIIPSVNELNKTIIDNSKLSASLHTENIQKSLSTMFQGVNIPEEEAIKMAKTVNGKNYQDFQNSNRTLDNEALRAMYNRKDKPGIGYGNLAKGYFGDETYGGKRIGTVLGAGAATAVGVRYLSGGNLTTNAQGERDIAGIPFI